MDTRRVDEPALQQPDAARRRLDRVTEAEVVQPDQRLDTAVKSLSMPTVVSLPAEIDIVNGPAVGQQLMAALRPGVSVVIADMSATMYCDSTALRHLIIANNHAVCTGAELRVVAPSPGVRRIMHVVGVDQMLRLYPDMTAALTAPQSEDQQTRPRH